MDFLVALSVFLVILTVIYFYFKKKYSFWKSRGVAGPTPIIPIGNMLDNFERPVMKLHEKRLEKYGHIYGVYEGTRPRLVVSDLNVMKKILIQDFNYFTNRRLDGFDHPIEQKMVFIWEGDAWRAGRAACSPAFSSGKLKAMTPLIQDAVDKLLDNIPLQLKKAEDNQLEVKSLFRAYALNNVGKTMFGVELDTFDAEKTDPIIKKALTYFQTTTIKYILTMILPKWFKTQINFTAFNKEGLDALTDLTKGIIKERSKSNLQKDYADFVSLMLQRRADQESSEKKDDKVMVFSDDEIIANCLLFLSAGTETSTTLLSFVCFMLAKHPKDQERVYQEIVSAIQDNGEITADSFNHMPFFHAVVDETLRLYPPAIFLERRVSEEYDLVTSEGKVINLPVDTLIFIPMYVIHRSEENFFQADQFIPERFMPENRQQIEQMTYLPFGHGPRNCIGIRTAMLNTKMALANVILKYRLESGEKTAETLDVSQTVDEMLVTPDIFIKFDERKKPKLSSG